MTKRRIVPRRASRPRTIEDQCLDHAEARLTRLIDERTRILERLPHLNGEILFYEGVVKTHTRDAQPPAETALSPVQTPPYLEPGPPVKPAPPTLPAGDQEAFLQRFIAPRPSRMRTTTPPTPPVTAPQPALPSNAGLSEDPDEFLRDDIPGHDLLS